MKNTAYSPLKVFHQHARLDAIRGGGHPSPVHVQLVPTNRCNQNCEGCAYRMENYPSNEQFDSRDELSRSCLEETVRSCQELGVRAIEVTGGGEPTVHPWFLGMCQLILDSGIDLGLVTNGSRWSIDHTPILSHAKWVRFSIDAGCEETYAKWRHVTRSVYGRVRQNLRDLVEAVRNNGLLIGVGFVVNEGNWGEVVTAAEKAKADGADNFRISALFQTEGASYFDEFRGEAERLCREAEKLNDEHFHVFNLFGNRLDDLTSPRSTLSVCGYSRLVTYIGADQHVYSCCMNAYNERGKLGSIADQSFAELWRSDALRKRLQAIDSRRCQRCMFADKNRTIAYALDTNPQHGNFL